MSNQECKVRPAIMNNNSNEFLFYPYSIAVNKFSGSFNVINNPYPKLCVSDFVKGINIKVFNLMPEINVTCNLTWDLGMRLGHARNNKQRWNNDKCRCECKVLISKGRSDDGFIWNPSKCESECDKSCDVGECWYYENCKCRKRLIDKSVEEYIENINKSETVCNVTLNDHGRVYKSCTK